MPRKKPRQQTLEATLGQPRLRETVARRAAARNGGGSSPSVQTSSPRHNAPPSSAPTAFSFMVDRSSPLKAMPQNVFVLDSSSDDEAEDKSTVEEIFEDEDHYLLSNGSSRPRIVRPRSLRSGRTIDFDDQPLRRTIRSPVKRQMIESDSDEDALPLLPSQRKKPLAENVPIKADDQSEDDDDVFSPRKTRKAKRDEPSDSDDKPLVTPSSTNRLKRTIVLDGSDEDVAQQLPSSPTKRRRLMRRGDPSSPVKEDKDEDDEPTPRPPPSSAARRKPRTEKEKARELLRRKRAGEVINEEEENDEEEEETVRPLYDSDPEHMALREFLDDDEGVLEIPAPAAKERSPKKKSPKKKKGRTIESGSDSDVNSAVNGSGDEDEDSDDNFVEKDDHIGVPDDAIAEIPIEFTSHSHKPLKDHFRDVIEWIIHYRINPGFVEKRHGIYRLGWQKLDDEVRGLAESKFASSAWKADFFMALRARPEFTTDEVGTMETNFGTENCSACGRSGHPAKHIIKFAGAPYYKSFGSPFFLEPVDVVSSSSSSSSSDEDDDDNDNGQDDHSSREVPDEDGNMIAPENKTWLIGSVCNSNAKDAHRLIHWKYALLTWVDANLEQGGYMSPKKIKKRLKWSPGERYDLVEEILKKWIADGVVRRLWKAHKDDIEDSRNKNTSGRYLR